jgi:hypothetical protein
MAVTLGRRIVVLVVTTLMAITMVAGPVASAADAVDKGDGKNNGWGDGKGGGKDHPKKKDGSNPGPV